MKVIAACDVAHERWDELCNASRQAWLFHRSDWMAIERYFVGVDHSFAVLDRDRIVAVQPLYLSDGQSGTGGERLLHSGIHRHTGLAMASGLASAERSAIQGAAMEHIFALAEASDVDRIQLNSHNLTPEGLSSDRQEVPFWVTQHGFQLGLNFGPSGMLPAPGMATCNADQLVYLDASEQELFAALDQKCRNALRQSLREELQFEVAQSHDAVKTYYALARLSSERTGESLPPESYYSEIWTTFSAAKRCSLLFVRHRAEPAAALLLLIDKQAASYAAGISDPRFLPMRVNNYIHWAAMLWAKSQGIRWYRFGPAFPEVPRTWPIRRVSDFKTKFGSQSRTVIQGSYFRRPERYLDAASAHLKSLCAPPPVPKREASG